MRGILLKMELWDIYNSNREKTGRLARRGDTLGTGEYHLVVFIIIKLGQDKFLISKRSPNKTLPNKWEFTGGSAIAGENSREAAVREVREELGIDLKTDGRIIHSFKTESESSFIVDVWLFEENVDLSQLKLQEDEVTDAKVVSSKTIVDLYENGDFMPLAKNIMNLFFKTFI